MEGSSARAHAYGVALLCITFGLLAGCSGGGGGGSSDKGNSAPVAQNGNIVTDPPVPSPPTSPTPVEPVPVPDTGPEPAPTPAPGTPSAQDPVITEFNYDPRQSWFVTHWFEVYNPGDTAVALSDYTLRASWREAKGNNILSQDDPYSLEPMEFALPAVSVPAKAYMVIASKAYPSLKDTRQAVYISKDRIYPDWTVGGSIELLKGGQTVDYVRYGASTAAPSTAGAWTGAGVQDPSSDIRPGGTFIRLSPGTRPATRSAQDWAQVNFATPAGPNDVPPNAVDADGDGIPDSAEVPGGTYAGLDLYAMGARTGRKDIFVEMDYMTYESGGKTYSLQPQEESLNLVVAAFAKKNIAVHFDVGSAYSPTFNPAKFNLGGGNPVPYHSCTVLNPWDVYSAGCDSFYEYKSRYMDARRRYLFNYSLSAQSNPGYGGQAEMGNDMILSVGGSEWTNGQDMQESSFNRHVNIWAGAIMHEMGHNLGLWHGGLDNYNYKPNHYSVMNYLYTYNGLSATPDSANAWDRFRQEMYYTDVCMLENSPCSKNFIIAYSDGSSADLNENAIDESLNIGRGSVAGAYADWNNDGRLTPGAYAMSLRKDSGGELTVLKDYDEWSNLTFFYSLEGRTKGMYDGIGMGL